MAKSHALPGMMLDHQDVRCTRCRLSMCSETLSPIVIIIFTIFIYINILFPGVGDPNNGTFRSWVWQLRNVPELGFATSERSVEPLAAAEGGGTAAEGGPMTTERSGVAFRNCGSFRSCVSQLRNVPYMGPFGVQAARNFRNACNNDRRSELINQCQFHCASLAHWFGAPHLAKRGPSCSSLRVMWNADPA